MKAKQVYVRACLVLLTGLAACSPSARPPVDTAVAVKTLQPGPVRLVSEADYIAHLPTPGLVVDFRGDAIMPVGLVGTPRTSFYVGEGIVAIADITWPQPTSNGGVHLVDWRLFRNNDLLKEKRTHEHLHGKPAHVISHISAGSFPPATYQLELLVDQKPLATLPFTILAAQAPAPLATPISGPDCKSNGPPTDKPSPGVHAFHPVFPIYPEKAAERGTGGCAAVSVVLDNDGHAAGIRIDAEYPPGLGFGVALAQAASATIYTPGHGGETTHITVHFSAPR